MATKKITDEFMDQQIDSIIKNFSRVLDDHQIGLPKHASIDNRLTLTMESLSIYAAYCINLFSCDADEHKIAVMFHFFARVDGLVHELINDKEPIVVAKKKTISNKKPTKKEPKNVSRKSK
jgi:hypothetical protein